MLEQLHRVGERAGLRPGSRAGDVQFVDDEILDAGRYGQPWRGLVPLELSSLTTVGGEVMPPPPGLAIRGARRHCWEKLP